MAFWHDYITAFRWSGMGTLHMIVGISLCSIYVELFFASGFDIFDASLNFFVIDLLSSSKISSLFIIRSSPRQIKPFNFLVSKGQSSSG